MGNPLPGDVQILHKLSMGSGKCALGGRKGRFKDPWHKKEQAGLGCGKRGDQSSRLVGHGTLRLRWHGF